MGNLRNFLLIAAVFAAGVSTADWFNLEWLKLSQLSQMIPATAPQLPPPAGGASRSMQVVETWLQPRDVGFALMAALAIVWLILRRKSADIKSYAGQTRGDLAALDRTAAHMQVTRTVNPPRALLNNPYGAEIQGVDFETRVQCAIEASLRASRVIGVVHLGLGRSGLHVGEGQALSDVGLERVAEALRVKLRSSDHVRVSADGKIEVFISLLATRDHLRKIATRLAQAVREIEPESGLALIHQPGCSIYPRDGYTSVELVDAARENALSLQVEVGHIDATAKRSRFDTLYAPPQRPEAANFGGSRLNS